MRKPRCAGGKKLAVCLLALMLLTGCSRWKVEGRTVEASPSLELLSMPAYEETAETVSTAVSSEEGPLRVDVWLDASQVMGGVNEHEDSIYPRASAKYRQGGFHYRYQDQVGWYENVLKDVLAAAEGSRTRLLRAGNERLTDGFLRSQGFDGTEKQLRSFRRDLLTYAIDPMPDVFSGFSSEKMTDSFYALGSPLMNQMERFAGDGGELLENPGRVEQMSQALQDFVAAFHQKKQEPPAEYSAVEKDDDSPLFYALQNLDTSRLSVITCDPAALRRLTGTEVSGTPVDYLEEILQERGIFDQGLMVGLYAMQLDYMGQMTSFGAADFAEPLLWGRPDYAENRTTQGAMPMPRILLMLAVGQLEQVRAYTEKLNRLLEADASLQGTRGPEKGQLCYTAHGETVTQEPFSFFYEYTEIQRPSAGLYTQRADGFTVQTEQGTVSRENGLYTVRLTGREGREEINLRWPLQAVEGAETLDLSQLTGTSVRAIDSLLLDSVLPNTPETAEDSREDRQILTLRDKRYVFVRQNDPFAGGKEENPFALTEIRWNREKGQLEVNLQVDHVKLKSGYYRLEVEASLSGKQILWPKVEWIDRLGTEITNSQISTWESFTQHLYRCGRRLKNVPKQFDHAWGPATSKPYQDVAIPDFPPVYRALHLQELVQQLREGANVENVPLIRCVFDVFVADMSEP